jgi:hypothetical protein
LEYRQDVSHKDARPSGQAIRVLQFHLETFMRIHSFSGAAVFGLGISLFWASAAASAPDARQIADSLVAATTATGRVQAEYQDATANGDVITVSGYKITRTSAKTIEIPAIIVTGAVMREAGGFTAQSIVFDKGTAIRGNDIVTWETGVVEGAIVPSAEEIKAEIDVRPFEKFAMSGVSLSESNLTKPVTAADIRVVLQAGQLFRVNKPAHPQFSPGAELHNPRFLGVESDAAVGATGI